MKSYWRSIHGCVPSHFKGQLCIIMYPSKTKICRLHVLFELYVCRCICVYSRKNMSIKTKLCLREMFCCSWGLTPPIEIFFKNKTAMETFFFFFSCPCNTPNQHDINVFVVVFSLVLSHWCVSRQWDRACWWSPNIYSVTFKRQLFLFLLVRQAVCFIQPLLNS